MGTCVAHLMDPPPKLCSLLFSYLAPSADCTKWGQGSWRFRDKNLFPAAGFEPLTIRFKSLLQHSFCEFQTLRSIWKWDDSTTLSNVDRLLRDNASAWFTSLKRSSVDALKWDVFKRAFLSVYGSDSETTSASHTVDFAALKQGPEERVLEFYTRVVKVTDPSPILWI